MHSYFEVGTYNFNNKKINVIIRHIELNGCFLYRRPRVTSGFISSYFIFKADRISVIVHCQD